MQVNAVEKPMLSDEELIKELERLKVAQPEMGKKQLLDALRSEGHTLSEKRLARAIQSQGNGAGSSPSDYDPNPLLLQAIKPGTLTFEKRHQVQREQEGKQTKVRPAPDIYGRAWHRANIKIDWTEELRRCKALEQRGEANAQLRRMTEVRTIDAGDRRVGLRGQKGLFARERIGVGTVFPLCCRVLLAGEYEAQFAGQPERRAEHERYCLMFTTGREWPEGPLVADLLSEGNALHLVNDPIGSGRQANCEFVEVLSRGWPLLFAVVVEPVTPGEELLLKYGEGYWSNVAQQHMRAGQFRRAGLLARAVLEEQLARLGQENRQVAATLELIADAHEQLGELEHAMTVHEQNLALRVRLVGADHILPVVVQERMARIRHRQGRLAEARDLYGRVVAFKLEAVPFIPEQGGARYDHLFGLSNNLLAAACLHARLGEPDLCRQALEAIARTPREVAEHFRAPVELDSDLAPARAAPWFPPLLAAFPPAPTPS